MSKSLQNRIARIEQKILAALEPEAAIVIFGDESETAVRERFTAARGYPPAIDCPVIRFTVMDCRRSDRWIDQ